MNGPRPRVALLVHGAGGGGWEWSRWVPALHRHGWRVTTPDLQPATDGIARTTFADYLGQVVRAGAGAEVLIGASLGAALVLKAAERLLPRALVLVSAVPAAGIAPDWPGRRVEFPGVVTWGGTGAGAAAAGRAGATGRAPRPPWRPESGRVLRELYRGVTVRRPGVPVLVLSGERDAEVPPACASALAAHLGADLIRLAGVGHVGALLGPRAGVAALCTARWLEVVLTGSLYDAVGPDPTDPGSGPD